MLYNRENLPNYVRTAGKITVVTALSGLLVFLVAFVFDFSAQELSKVSAAGTATTTLTVLNTPPEFTLNPYEVIGSATSTPTNSGDVLQWSAIGTDANAADYFLLVCSSNSASATPKTNAPPECGAGVQWGVSATTTSGALATVSTTTEEWGTGDFAEVNLWYAWVCDADATDPKCSVIPETGDYATSSSPFHVNNRPVFDVNLTNDGPVDPGGVLAWNSTSSDPDTVDAEDTLYLVICSSNSDYDTNLNTCPVDFLASTTLNNVLSDVAATMTIPAIQVDDTYPAYGYIVDEHGHEALGNGQQANYIVSNVAPVVIGGDIDLNGGIDMTLTNADAGETTGFTLNFKVSDANSCENFSAGAEITGYRATVFRSDIGTTTCDGSGTNYDANNCYDSGVATTTWNLVCTPDACGGIGDPDIDYTCFFPLWFIADATDAGPNTPPAQEVLNWSAGVYGIDDNAANGSMATATIGVDVKSAAYIDVGSSQIAYGEVEPGNATDLVATSTTINIGNTGLDQDLQGSSMCNTYSLTTPCPGSASSTIDASEQKFASTTMTYINPLATNLSSTSPTHLELDVAKSLSTTTPNSKLTYWGINVPGTISLAGSYTGLNTFSAKVAEPADW